MKLVLSNGFKKVNSRDTLDNDAFDDTVADAATRSLTLRGVEVVAFAAGGLLVQFANRGMASAAQETTGWKPVTGSPQTLRAVVRQRDGGVMIEAGRGDAAVGYIDWAVENPSFS